MTTSQYTECYTAYLDILGAKALVLRSEREPRLRERLATALVAIKETPPYLESKRDDIDHILENVLRIQVLSDSVILFIPATTSLAWFLWVVRRLYDKMICLGLCFRGAITLGGMLWEEQNIENYAEGVEKTARSSVALGPALVNAYLLESEVAVYPRILISEPLHARIRNIDFQKGNAENPLDRWNFPLVNHGCRLGLSHFVKTDFDGRPYFDILNRNIHRHDKIGGKGTPNDPNDFDDTPGEVWVQRYRDVAAENLGSAKDEKIKAKYAWLLNYVCRSCAATCPAPVDK